MFQEISAKAQNVSVKTHGLVLFISGNILCDLPEFALKKDRKHPNSIRNLFGKSGDSAEYRNTETPWL